MLAWSTCHASSLSQVVTKVIFAEQINIIKKYVQLNSFRAPKVVFFAEKREIVEKGRFV